MAKTEIEILKATQIPPKWYIRLFDYVEWVVSNIAWDLVKTTINVFARMIVAWWRKPRDVRKTTTARAHIIRPVGIPSGEVFGQPKIS